jgi:hypothetical protein
MESSQRLSEYYIYFTVNVTSNLASIFTKGQEFHTWLVEERKINPETISKDQNKKEFARFMEDYNTGMFHSSFSQI